MYQLVVLSTGWATFFHSVLNGVHQCPFLFVADQCTFFFWVLGSFSLGLNLTHSYHAHFPILISIASTLVPYLLSPTNIATLITNYPIDLTIVLTTYPTNLVTLLHTLLT